MASATESRVIYAAGVAQGIALVTFPATSTVLTSPNEFDLSNTQYGTLFLPQVVTAIAAALLGASAAGRYGTKRVYLAGLAAGLVAMTLLVISPLLIGDGKAPFAVLLASTACLGAGFGLCVPALNTFAAAFHPSGVDRAILVLNALLGLGTVLAPVLAAIFVGLDIWWALPIVSGCLLLGLILVSRGLPLQAGPPPAAGQATRRAIPRRFWAYAAFAVLYGVCETVNGNWSQLDMTTEVGASATQAALALTAFWGMVTVGRVFFAAVQAHLAARVVYHVLPFGLAVAFVLIAVLPDDRPELGILAFGLAGLGCSALLPLTISFGQEELTAFAAAVAGGVIACYQVGYGIAAFGIGPLVDAGVGLSTVYAAAAAVAVVLGACSLAVARSRPDPSSFHPQLGSAAR